MADRPHEFTIDPDEMRRIGYRVIDAIVERFQNIEAMPAVRVGDAEALARRLEGPMPEDGRPFDDILEDVLHDVLPYSVALAHPRFFAFIASPGNYISTMADALAAGFNPFVGTWLGGSGPSALELVTIGWLREMCGLPPAAGGLFVSGGSTANLTALAVARHIKAPSGAGDGIAYYGDQTHYSNERALRTLGFASDQLRPIASNERFEIDVDSLRDEVREDTRSGRRPMCVVATAGTTNVGAVDPIADIADVCREHDLWLHVDGAYGAAAAISPRLRGVVADIALADSVSLDPHKWLFQPFEIGCVLVRDAAHLRKTFQMMPDYLKDVHDLGEVNFADRGVQLTRGFRALKLWMSLQYYGAKRFRRAVERGVELAEYAQAQLDRRAGWEVVTSAHLGIVTFRRVVGGWDDERTSRLNDAVTAALMRDGFAMVSSTVLAGKTALRLCTINPATTREHVDETLDRLEGAVQRLITGGEMA